MDGIQAIFANLTAPQAEAISSGVTLLSALIVALVAPLCFHLLAAKGMKSFEKSVEDLEKSSKRAEDQAAGIGRAVTAISSKVEELSELLSSLQESVATTQNTILEARPAEVVEAEERPLSDQNDREKIKTIWRVIRELVERAASHPSINGQTRARYARMDRRNFPNLLTALDTDRNLPGELNDWREAYSIYSYAVHAGTTSPEKVARLSELLAQLMAKSAEHAELATRAREEVRKAQIRSSNISTGTDSAQAEAATYRLL